MSINAGTVYVDVVPNTDKFASSIASKVGGSTRSLASKLLPIAKGAAVGFGALATAAGAAFHQFEESQNVSQQTDAVIKSTGGSANVTAKEVQKLSMALSRKSAIDDEVIQSGANMLLTFTNVRNEAGKGNDVFNHATKTLTDLSAAMGTEPKQAAIQLGKALNDPVKGITALTRVGVTFDDQQKKQIETMVKHNDTIGAQKMILAELDKEFGGSAEAQKTSTAAMGVAWGNLVEKIGGMVAPLFERLFGTLTKLATFLMHNIGPAVKGFMGWLKGLWERAQPVVHIFLDAVMPALKSTWAIIQKNLVPSLAHLWRSLQPVLKVLGAIAGLLVIGLIKVLPIVIRLFAGIVNVLAGVVTAISKVIGWIAKLVMWLGDKLAGAWNKVQDVAVGIWDAVRSAFDALINGIKSAWNNTVGGFGFSVPSWVPGLGGKEFRIPELAEGGIVTRPTVALIGEAGPEAVVPLHEAASQVAGAWRAGDRIQIVDSNLGLVMEGVVRRDRDYRGALSRMGRE